MSAKKPTASTKSARAPTAGAMVLTTATKEPPGRWKVVNFGAVSVNAAQVQPEEWQRNVDSGRAALARAVPKLAKAGVVLKMADSVPRFRADPKDPSRLIREVNGKVETGQFVNGRFRVLINKR